MKVRKAVVPVAGFGTRLLPITKAVPKEMLPIVDRPLLQYIVEELVAAGIEDIIFVTSTYKKAIEDYFNPHFELETNLAKNGKEKELAEIKRISDLANFVFIRQKKIGGNGDAILTAESVIGKEPFVVAWGDDIFQANPKWITQPLKVFEKYQTTVMTAFNSTDPEDGGKYGFAVGEEVEESVIKVKELIEKPGVGKAPSNYATISGFVLTPDIFPALRQAKEEIGDLREMNYIDGLKILMKTKDIYAMQLTDYRFYDTGNKLGYLKTIIELGLEHKEIGEDLRKFIKELSSKI